jgi:DNA-binding transcriptional ArsR family regulator
MPTRDAIPPEILDQMASKFRMLADSTRLAILRVLMLEGEKNVSQVVEETGRTQANVSKHLKHMAEAGLLARRKEGLQVFYRLDDPVIEKVCRLVCDSILNDLKEQLERHRKLIPPPDKP